MMLSLEEVSLNLGGRVQKVQSIHREPITSLGPGKPQLFCF